MSVENIQDKELKAIKNEKINFALSVWDEVIFVHFKIKNFYEWSEMPYTIHLSDFETLPSPNMPKGYGNILTVILIESTNAIVKHLRLLAFSNNFSNKLNQAIHHQYNLDFNKDLYNQKVDQLYSRYTSKQLVERSIVKCTSGEK